MPGARWRSAACRPGRLQPPRSGLSRPCPHLPLHTMVVGRRGWTLWTLSERGIPYQRFTSRHRRSWQRAVIKPASHGAFLINPINVIYKTVRRARNRQHDACGCSGVGAQWVRSWGHGRAAAAARGGERANEHSRQSRCRRAPQARGKPERVMKGNNKELGEGGRGEESTLEQRRGRTVAGTKKQGRHGPSWAS